MTQPPGPYGDPYGPPQGHPAPYGPPAGYGPPGPYGPPPPPPRKSLLPWLIVGAAVLLSGVGLLFVLLLTRADSRVVDAGMSGAPTSAAPSTSGEPRRAPSLDGLPGGAQVTEPQAAGGNAFTGSDGVALAWVEGMADGDFQAAYDLSCPEVQDAAATTADGGDPASELARYFYEQTLGGVGFTEGTFDSIQYDDATGTDIAAFTLAMEDGGTFTLLVYVREDLTVCDFR
jgi:hypothetical protein